MSDKRRRATTGGSAKPNAMDSSSETETNPPRGFIAAALDESEFVSAALARSSRMARCAGRVAIVLLVVLVVLAPHSASASELQQPPTSYPLCTATSVAGFPWTHPAFGHSIPGIALRNMSLSTCRVAGYPELRAYTPSGQPADVRYERKPFIDTRIYAYSVTPGSAVFFAFYGHPPQGEFDRSCTGISQVDIFLPEDRHPIDVTISTGTCGGRMSYSQMFPVSELAR